MVTRRFVPVLLGVLLAGCATAADIKPGVIRGLDDRGYVKTSEGFGLLVRGCPDRELWTAILETAKTLRPSHFYNYGPLIILSADEATGTIKAEDRGTFWRKGSYVGIFIHRLRDETRLIEISSFWDTRTVVNTNPWEADLLAALRTRLLCIVPAESSSLTEAVREQR